MALRDELESEVEEFIDELTHYSHQMDGTRREIISSSSTFEARQPTGSTIVHELRESHASHNINALEALWANEAEPTFDRVISLHTSLRRRIRQVVSMAEAIARGEGANLMTTGLGLEVPRQAPSSQSQTERWAGLLQRNDIPGGLEGLLDEAHLRLTQTQNPSAPEAGSVSDSSQTRNSLFIGGGSAASMREREAADDPADVESEAAAIYRQFVSEEDSTSRLESVISTTMFGPDFPMFGPDFYTDLLENWSEQIHDIAFMLGGVLDRAANATPQQIWQYLNRRGFYSPDADSSVDEAHWAQDFEREMHSENMWIELGREIADLHTGLYIARDFLRY